MELFKLVGKIFVDSKEAENSISKTGKEADGLGDKLAKGLGTAAKWGAGIAAAATAVGGAMIAAAKSTASELDVIDKASQRMKISAESYQELAYAAGLSGVEMSTLEEAAKKLAGTDLSLDKAIAQLQAIKDDGERSAAAIELFGEQAYQLTPLLNAGTDGMEAMTQEANALGLVMSNESVSSGAAMNDMFSKLDQTFGMVKNTIMVDLMPYVMEILDWLVQNLPIVAETVKKVMDKVMPIIKPVLDAVLNAFKAVFSLLNGDFDGFVKSIKEMWDNLVEFLDNFCDAFMEVGKNIFNSLWDGLKFVWDEIKGWVSDKVSWLADKLKFWEDGNDRMKADGSNASGLPFVPFDGYKAILHRGETVLNSDNTSKLLSMLSANSFSSANTMPSEITIVLKSENGQNLGRWLVPFVRSENKSNPEVVSDV